MRLKITLLNAPDDHEKLVLPGLIYVSRELDGWRGYSLSLSWWHWGIGVFAALSPSR